MAQPGNYLVNGGFEDDFRGWGTFSDIAAGADVAFSIESSTPIDGSKSARMDINGTGTEPFHAGLDQRFTIHKDQEVELVFRIKASTETFINIEVSRAYGDFDAIIRSPADLVANANIAVGPTTQTIRYLATASYSDANYKVAFMFGNIPSGATIWVDSVVIHQTQAPWDGNILPNYELDELYPRDASLPPYRTAQLAFSLTPFFDGGWEGGFADPNVPDLNVTFGVDSSGRLSGDNSFYIDVQSKVVADFFHGFNYIFFWAQAGETYEYSFDVVASEAITFSTAMNQEPFGSVNDHFFLDVNATTDSQRVTIQTSRPMDNTQLHKIFQANYPVGSDYQIYLDNIRLLRMGAADTSDFSTPTSVQDARTRFSQVQVYPNPAVDGRFTVNLASSQVPAGSSIEVSLMSLEGKEVFHQVTRLQGTTLELAPVLPSGSYVLQLRQDHHVFMKKLIIR
jgi:hypothetical protein